MVDPVSLVGMILTMVPLIARAADTAQQNKKKCRELAQRAGTLANVLPNYTYAAANDQDTARVLHTLKEALDEARTLIHSCQTRSRKAAELDGVNAKINQCINDLNFIRNGRTNHVAAAGPVPLPAQTYDHGSYYQYQAQGAGGASSSACVGYPPPQHAPVNVHWTPAPSPYHACPAAPSTSGYNPSSLRTLFPTVSKVFDSMCNGFR
ncbi:uncharacterized protein [Triticum aestivum]|nr:uncharacterized protein LOC123186722 [Triticum aestivum]